MPAPERVLITNFTNVYDKKYLSAYPEKITYLWRVEETANFLFALLLLIDGIKSGMIVDDT